MDSGAVPDASTINTSQLPEVDSGQRVGRTRCVYDGAETRIDWMLIGKRSYRDLSTVIAKKIIIANDNYAPEMALAA